MDSQAFQLLMSKLSEQDKRFDEIDQKIDVLLRFKWQIIGGSVILSTVITVVIQIISILNKH